MEDATLQRAGRTVVALQVLGWAALLIGTLICGAWLRANPSKENAEKSSRVTHLLFWLGYGVPASVATFRPGLTKLDKAVGIPSLPARRLARLLGVLLLGIGSYFMVASNRALRLLGEGAAAFKLTRGVVADDVYERTRNPMSLGLYLQSAGIGLVAGSTSITLGWLLAGIPTHVFYLKYFEELELELRFGQSYLEYRDRVPFLIPRIFPGPAGGKEMPK